MFSINVFLGDTIQVIPLLYRSEEAKDAALKALEQVDSMIMSGGQMRRLVLEDDFGQRLVMHRQPISILIQDMKMAREADVERAVFQAITQAKAQDRAKEDPTLKAHFRAQQQGVSVFSPMGGPMNGRGF